MLGLTTGELLFYAGTVLAGAAVVAAVVAAVAFHLSGKRLQARLEQEYGKKRH